MAKRRTNKNKRDLYQQVTDRILEMLNQGTVPWRNPIRRSGGDGWPRNLSSRKRYRGINVFLLAMTSLSKGYGSDYWLTFKQAQEKGGTVRKGEKSSLVTFWKLCETKDRQTGEEMTVPVLRHYHVFNADQCEGIEPPDAAMPDLPAQPFAFIAAAVAIVEGFSDRPAIEHRGHKAVYRPISDVVQIPEPDRFESRESYYATLFHELVHSTGHSTRLHRGLDTSPAPFGSPDYSKEELIAEMGAAFLAAAAGLSPPTIEQSAAYIDGWRKALKGDAKLVITAAGAAQKAATLILGEAFFEATEPRETEASDTPQVAPAPQTPPLPAKSPRQLTMF